MSETKCPKCGREMIRGSNETLGRNFACTRNEPKPKKLRIVKIQSYHCCKCGYMEFYKELRERGCARL